MVGLTVPQDINLGKNMYFFIRASFISKRLAKTNKIIGIYNGFAFLTMTLNKKMAGYRLGEFSGTRRTPKHKGKKAQKNKVKKKKK
jgi:ribosomal protein S19